ncbi:major facilitator superfamily transporter [Colletotrichum simmondsii]|uniref:Major facilitator superfamily transporter n=1 Tax=Colletotrichum simmondsii TaxID=703756 RepID=A0A135SK22_9PEZI|nr:major facilitator superfamily transporter [Colletotrichum simmondsii]
MATPQTKDDTKILETTSYPEATDHAAGTSYVYDEGAVENVDEAYLRASKSTRFYRGVLFQMILFGALSFVGPAMSDAISNLGGGGLSTPYLANLATALSYMAGCLITVFGGPLINKIGIKWSCMIAAVTMPLAGSAYYVSAKYSIDWYLLFARLLGGFTSGFLYVAETAAMLSYPEANDRGFYLGIWSAMRNSGSVMGGAINFSTNYSKANAGGIAWSTYLIFVGFGKYPSLHIQTRLGACSNTSHDRMHWNDLGPAPVTHQARTTPQRREDPNGQQHQLEERTDCAVETLAAPKAAITIVMVLAYGKLLDTSRWSQARRAWISFFFWVIPQAMCFIWIGIEYSKFGGGKIDEALDYELHTRRWAEAYLPYLIMFSTGYWTQLSLYWILGTFSTDVGSSSRSGGLFRAFETAGQAVSYALNSKTSADPRIPFYVNAALMAITIPCMVFLIRLVPEAPASTDIDAGDVVEDQAERDPDNK